MLLSPVLATSAVAPQSPTLRPYTLADSISMTRVVSDEETGGPPFLFSPDGTQVLLVTEQGDLRQGVRRFSLLRYRTRDVLSFVQGRSGRVTPDVLITLESASNADAIRAVRWLPDGETVTLLGIGSGNHPALYFIDTRTGEARQVSAQNGRILAYEATRDLNILSVATPRSGGEDRNDGPAMTVTTQGLQQLLGVDPGFDDALSRHVETFVYRAGQAQPVRLQEPPRTGFGTNLRYWLSPDGRHAIGVRRVRRVPKAWEQYFQPLPAYRLRATQAADEVSMFVEQYVLIDTTSGEVRPIVDAPLGVAVATHSPEMALWLSDGRSVILTNTLLPLDVEDAAELARRRADPFVAELDLESRTLTPITALPPSQYVASGSKAVSFSSYRWNAREQVLSVQRRRSGTGEPLPDLRFVKRAGRWIQAGQVPSPARGSEAGGQRLVLSVAEDLNTPPHVVAADGVTGHKAELLELNPQLHTVKLARSRMLQWQDRRGVHWRAGLMLPVSFDPARRYPLVIQTHGFPADRFLIDGRYATVSAAQGLANRGIVVLQLEDHADVVLTPEEGPAMMAGYESAIDTLDERRLIDPQRVGLVGFSRTSYHVKYALTHSDRRFAAAVVADGFDAGYLQYLTSLNLLPGVLSGNEQEALNGGMPYGADMKGWLERAPGFNLPAVHTPLRIEAIGHWSVLDEWEWYVGLKRLRKPVEMHVIAQGTHVLVKPQERYVSQQGVVDWFDFWLNGRERTEVVPDAPETVGSLADQYRRWRTLRELQPGGAQAASEARLRASIAHLIKAGECAGDVRAIRSPAD